MAVKQIVEGVYRISLSWSNVYVLTDGNEAVLIDTGLKQDRSALLAGLQQIGIAETQVTAVLLTHAHCDHAGNVAYFTRTSGGKAKLSVHRLEAPYIVFPRQPYTPKGFGKLLRPFTSLCLAVGEYLFPVERCSVEVLLEQDTMVEAPGGALRVIACPGHTPGHVAYFRERDGLLFTGDAILTIKPHLIPALRAFDLSLSLPLFSSNFQQAKASALHLTTLTPTSLLSGHGRPIVENTSERLAAWIKTLKT